MSSGFDGCSAGWLRTPAAAASIKIVSFIMRANIALKGQFGLKVIVGNLLKLRLVRDVLFTAGNET
jgi:hypothetical protein